MPNISGNALLQRPLEHLPPLQSESEPHEPHLLFEHFPILQSESVPHEPHLPLEHLPQPLQSESVPQLPHLLLEHFPKPLQSESVPQLPAEARAEPSTSTIAITRYLTMRASYTGSGRL